MTKENKEVENKVDDTTDQDASTEETTEQEVEKDDADETATDDASTQETKEIDYKAELEKVSKERDNYKTGLLNEKAKNKGKKDTVQEQEQIADGEQPEFVSAEELTRKIESDMESKFQEQLDATRRELVDDSINAELESLTDNPDKQKLILFHYVNTIKQSGISRQAIQKDLKRAMLIADESRLARENAELKEALKAKKSLQKPVTGTNQSPVEGDDDIKFTPAEKALIERQAQKAGISFKEYVRRHKSQLTQ